MIVASGITFYVLSQPLSGAKQSSVIHWTPQMGTPSLPTAVAANTPSVAFLSKTYQLASFNNKTNPMWEFVTGREDVSHWTTLLTIVDRSDARTRPELDRLAEGVMTTYKSNGAQILLARTMQDETGTAFNYMVAAFDQPAQHRMELNFVKFVLGSRNANIAIYGVRIADPQDYRAKAKEYLNRSSSEVGQALGQLALPDISNLPRREF